MRGWLAYSFCVHALLLVAALGASLHRHEVSMPRVAAVSISSAATPPSFPVPHDVALAAPALPEPPVIPKPQPGELYVPPEPLVQVDPQPQEVPAEPVPTPVRQPMPRELRKPEPPVEPATAPAPEAPPAQVESPGPPNQQSVQSATLDSSDCDAAPQLNKVDWPRVLRRRFEGTVVVRVEIDRLGKLVALHLVEGTGRKEWDDALLAAMKEAEYQPARKADLPVACRHVFRIKFEQS